MLHRVRAVKGNALVCVTVTLLGVPARAENMDPQCPYKEEEHRHADVELGERNLSSRQEAVRILLHYVDLKSEQFSRMLPQMLFLYCFFSSHFCTFVCYIWSSVKLLSNFGVVQRNSSWFQGFKTLKIGLLHYIT